MLFARGMRALDPQPPRAMVMNAAVIVICLIWGSTWLVIREGLEDLPPFFSAGMRFSVAAGCMVALVPALRRIEGGTRPATWLWIVAGTCNFTVAYAVVYWCERTLPSGLVSLLWALFPMLVAISGHWFLPGERLRVPQWLGFVLGFAGVGLLFQTDLRLLGPEAVWTGALLLVSPLASTVGNTLIKRYGAGHSSVVLNRNGMALAALGLLAASGLSEGDARITWSAKAIFSVAYLALVGTVVTFGVYFWLLRYAPAHRLSLIAYVTPPIALVLGWLVADEPVTRFTLAGAALILVGIVLVVRRSSRRSTPLPEPGPR